ncbi:MAG: PIG-L family deacetylase, partial [Anaerolineae bacterium]
MDASKAQSFGRHVFLSPHLDDVVLSCGGTVARLAQQRESVLVVTVFGGDPDLDRLSSFAQETHAAWGDPPTPYATRRAEDRAGVARLGATPLHLGFQDAIYRRDAAGVPIYTSNEVLFGPPRATDGALVDRLETVLRSLVCRLGPTALYIPLAVGRHVDHQLVARAAWRLLAPPSTAPELWWYEDFPYAAGGFPEHAPDTVSAALARWSEGTWRSREMAIDPAVKIEAIDCYASQVPMLFEDGEAMEQAVRDYSASLS